MARFNSFNELAAAMNARAAEVRGALRQATKEQTEALWLESKQQMESLIYANPPDTTSYSWRYQVRRTSKKTGREYTTKTFKPLYNDEVLGREKWTASERHAERARKSGTQDGRQAGRGRAKWRQTGRLKGAERSFLRGDVGYVTNATNYAIPRHELGLRPGDPDSYTGRGSRRRSTRIAPWRSRAIRAQEPFRMERYRKALWAALTR